MEMRIRRFSVPFESGIYKVKTCSFLHFIAAGLLSFLAPKV